MNALRLFAVFLLACIAFVEAAKNKTTTSNAACFPGNAMVQLKGGRAVPMSDLHLGMEVAVGGGRYSPVFGFTHKVAGGERTFVRITTSQGILDATEGHYVAANGAYAAAGKVRVGDVLRTAGGTPATVMDVTPVVAEGLYNPQTKHGDIVVNGLVASTYTTAVERHVAHAALAPLRAAWARFGFGALLENGKDTIVF